MDRRQRAGTSQGSALPKTAEDRLLEALTLCDEAESRDEIYVDDCSRGTRT